MMANVTSSKSTLINKLFKLPNIHVTDCPVQGGKTDLSPILTLWPGTQALLLGPKLGRYPDPGTRKIERKEKPLKKSCQIPVEYAR